MSGSRNVVVQKPQKDKKTMRKYEPEQFRDPKKILIRISLEKIIQEKKYTLKIINFNFL